MRCNIRYGPDAPGGGGGGDVDPNKEVAKQLLDRVTTLATGVKELTDKVKTIETASAGAVDVKKVVEEHEKLRAAVESLQDSIAKKRNAMYFSGLEDVKQSFNLLKLIAAVKTCGNDKEKMKKTAGFEMEIIEETRKAMEKHGHPATRAGHAMWDDQAGGMWVPDQVLADVIAPIYTQSVFAALDPESGSTRVTVLDGLTGNPVKIPEFEGGMIAYWIGEEDEYAESKTKSGNMSMTPKKLGILTRITVEMMNMANPAFDKFVRRDMVRAASKKLDYTIMYGKGGDNIPLGIMNNTRIAKFFAENKSKVDPGSFTAGGAELDFDGLMEMQGALEDDDIAFDSSFATVSHGRWFRRLKKLKIDNFSGQTANKPYLLGAPFLSDQRLQGIIGEFDRSNQIKTNNMVGGTTPGTHDKGTDVIMGNLAEVLLGRWAGIQILDDGGTGTGFIRDQTYVKMRMWADVQVRQPRALLTCRDARCRD